MPCAAFPPFAVYPTSNDCTDKERRYPNLLLLYPGQSSRLILRHVIFDQERYNQMSNIHPEQLPLDIIRGFRLLAQMARLPVSFIPYAPTCRGRSSLPVKRDIIYPWGYFVFFLRNSTITSPWSFRFNILLPANILGIAVSQGKTMSLLVYPSCWLFLAVSLRVSCRLLCQMTCTGQRASP